MKVKKVRIPIFNHSLNVFEITNKRDADKLIKELKSLRILNENDEKEIRDNIENGADGACTYYRKADCTLVVVIYMQSNQDRRREVLSHEKRHVEDHILEHLGIDDMESAAYLAGYLAREVFY
jgi:hypothetical protein